MTSAGTHFCQDIGRYFVMANIVPGITEHDGRDVSFTGPAWVDVQIRVYPVELCMLSI